MNGVTVAGRELEARAPAARRLDESDVDDGAGLVVATPPPLAIGALRWDRASLLFSACNEDTRSELRALGSLQDRRVMCVTAGGGRVLSLLAGRPASILAVDLNPVQNALLELKIAAMRQLEHDGYLRFLGVRDAHDRLSTYARLRALLTPFARSYFDREADLIEAGVLFQGRLERFLRRVAKVIRPLLPGGILRLAEAASLDDQRRLLDRLETRLWRLLVETICRRSVLRAFSGDPGFFRYLPAELPLHRVLYERIHTHLRHCLLRDNPVLQLAFHGKYSWEPALPLYLHADHYAGIRAALRDTTIRIVTATVDEALGDERGQLDAYSLSDISSYLDDDAHAVLFDRVAATASAGARVCSRSNLHHRALALGRTFERAPDLEAELQRNDHACVHDFVVGTLR